MTTKPPYQRPPPTTHRARPSPEEEARREIAQDTRAAFRDLTIVLLFFGALAGLLYLRFGFG